MSTKNFILRHLSINLNKNICKYIFKEQTSYLRPSNTKTYSSKISGHSVGIKVLIPSSCIKVNTTSN